LEVHALARKLRALVYMQQVNRFGISVSENELYQYWSEVTTDMDQEAIQKDQKMLEDIYSGLTQVVVEGKNKDKVYKGQLAGVVSKEQWEAYLRTFDTPEKLVTLEKQVEDINSGNVQPDEGVKSYLQQQKLQEAIDHKLAAQSDGFFKAKEKIEKGTATIDDYNFVNNKRLDWWRETYRQADIVIKDNKYSEALTILLGESDVQMQGKWLSTKELEIESSTSQQDDTAPVHAANDMESQSSGGGLSVDEPDTLTKDTEQKNVTEKSINVVAVLLIVVIVLVVAVALYKKQKKMN
jgi:hypothetical protein